MCIRHFSAALSTATVDPQLLTAAEKFRYEGFLHRDDVKAVCSAP
jgi:hypothetical protein